jgi:predicted transcriptional regulator of viral defense system
MKCSPNLLAQLSAMPHFEKRDVLQLGEQLGLEASSVNTCISRFLHRKEIIRLKNGLYVSTDFFMRNAGDVSYSFHLANVIRTPSYVSCWAALQHYNLSTEATYSITSVTPKVTRSYRTRAGHFSYHSIKKSLFSGFSLTKGKFCYFLASPSKALFDLLYFRTNQLRRVTRATVKALVNELRIDLEEMDKSERDNFYALVSAHE